MEKSAYLFKNLDGYDTPENKPVSLLFRLLLKNRLYFYFYNYLIYCRTGQAGAKNQLDKENMVRLSSGNIHLVERCGGKFHIRGLENLRALNGQPAVIISNHMSLLETAVTHAIAGEYVDFSFVVKESLLKIPFFRHIMFALKAIPVTRTNPREDLKTVLTKGKEILKSGRSIVLYPQATRSETFDPEKFNSIGIKLAKAAGVPVIPCALKTDFLGNGKYIKDLGPVRPERKVCFEFAPAMNITGNGKEEHEAIVAFIQERLDTWRAQEQQEVSGDK